MANLRRIGARMMGISALLVLVGCADTDPYNREGIWRPSGTNDANLRAMVANPADLARGVGDGTGDSQQAEAAIERLRADKVKALPASGIAQINITGGGSSSGGSGSGSGAAGAGGATGVQ